MKKANKKLWLASMMSIGAAAWVVINAIERDRKKAPVV